jgi:hypothetical protein
MGLMSIAETLEQAKTAGPPKLDGGKEKPKRFISDKHTFVGLQKEVSRTIERHLALDQLMGVLDRSKVEFQFAFKIEPTLAKYATQVFEDQTKKVFEFDRVHTREIAQSLRQATEGIAGMRQLPRLLLIGLISEYDVFLHRLIRVGLASQEGIVSRIDRSLSLKELKQFATIEDASEFLIEREIDSILHDDHFDQLSAVGGLFNIKIEMKDRCVKEFLEICERRNLFTHNAGVVNARYLKKCKEYGVGNDNLKAGDVLGVSSKYYRPAISTTHELCIKLLQFIWRKLVPTERDNADLELNQTAFDLMRSGDYKLAEGILNYGISQTGRHKDSVRRMMVVNYANAIKQGGDKARAIQELDKFDWTATSRKFQISVAAVKDDLATVLRLMPAVAKADIDESEFRTWPVFRDIRAEKSFQEKFRTLFGSELIATPALAASRAFSAGDDQVNFDPSAVPERKRTGPTKH